MKKEFKLEKDFIEFLELCNKHSVKYLIIGGYAVGIYGYPRYTKDLDVCIELSDENATKVIAVIDEFGLESLGLTKEDFLKIDFIIQLGNEPLRISYLNDMDSVPYSQAWENRKEVMFEDVKINFIGYKELLLIKAKAGRKQDLADIEKLKARNKQK